MAKIGSGTGSGSATANAGPDQTAHVGLPATVRPYVPDDRRRPIYERPTVHSEFVVGLDAKTSYEILLPLSRL